MPLLCETVTGRSMAELLAARDACRDGDLVELRLDGVAGLDVAAALRGRQKPVIVTCRPTWEGGRFDGAEDARLDVLTQALDGGAELVDVEWRAGWEALVRQHQGRIVLSSHDFDRVPSDLVERAAAMRALGAAYIKVAVMPRSLGDMLVLKQIAAAGRAVVIGMGDVGLPSRLLAAHFGSAWSYAGSGVAPGQVPAARMIDEFRFRDTDAATLVYGVVGNNVTKSLSPVMHNAAFRAAGVNAVYVPFLPADFDDFRQFAEALGVRGASVTIPYKLDALHAATDVDARAAAIGAANTLKRTTAGWSATNTDVDGFLAPLEAAYPGPLTGVRASVLGAGGSARAVVYALQQRGARVTVHARRDAQARALASAFDVAVGPWPVAGGSWDLLVNCTPVGSGPARDQSPLAGGALDGTAVYDLTYRPPDDGVAPLLEDARRAGCVVLDGLPMLIAQAERQFQYWTGGMPPEGVMAAAVRAGVGRSEAAPAVAANPHPR